MSIPEGKGIGVYTEEKEVDGKIIEEEYLQESWTSFLPSESLRKVRLFKLEDMDDNICILQDVEIVDRYYLLYNTEKNIYYSILYDYLKFSYRTQIRGDKKAKTWVSKARYSGNKKDEYEYNAYDTENGIRPNLWYDKFHFRNQIKPNVAAIGFRMIPQLDDAYMQLSELLKQTDKNKYDTYTPAYDLLRNQHIFGMRSRPRSMQEIEAYYKYYKEDPFAYAGQTWNDGEYSYSTEEEIRKGWEQEGTEDEREIRVNDFLFSNDPYFRGFLNPILGYKGEEHYWKSSKPHKFVGRTHQGVRWNVESHLNYDELNASKNESLRRDFLSQHRDFINFSKWLSRQKKKYPNEKYEKLWLPYPQNYLIKDQRYNYKDENMFVPDESYGGLLMLNAIVVRKK